MAAKYLRCSVEMVKRHYQEDDIDNAVTAATANNKLQQFMIEHPKKK